MNISRIGCPGDVLCPCPCKVLAFSCPHRPKCMARSRRCETVEPRSCRNANTIHIVWYGHH
jgi:hypothetical protein